MTLAEQPRSDESTSSQDICLNNVAPCQSSANNNHTIEETAVVHAQPASQQIYKVENDDDDEDSSSSCDDEDAKRNNHQVVERLSDIPQTSVKTIVDGSSDVNVTNVHKNVFGKVVLNQNFYSYPKERVIGNLDAIDVVQPTTEKIDTAAVDKEPEIIVEAKQSNLSSQQLCAEGKETVWWRKRHFIVISGAVLAGIVFIVSLLVYFVIPGCDVCIVSRSEWQAQAPREAAKPLKEIPARYVIIIHTRTATCSTKARCSNAVRDIQKIDMNHSNKTDISYNWLVGGDDGLVYECRGWDVEGDHTKNYDQKSIGIGFIGFFRTDAPSKAQIDAAKKLIEKGVEEKKIREDYLLFGQRQCLQTGSESPGDAFYEIIKTWDNWSPACI